MCDIIPLVIFMKFNFAKKKEGLDLELFPFPGGLKKYFSDEELNIIETEAKRLIEIFELLKENKKMNDDEIKEYYRIFMHDKYFDEIIEKTKKALGDVTGKMKELMDILIDDMEMQKITASKKASVYKEKIDVFLKEIAPKKR